MKKHQAARARDPSRVDRDRAPHTSQRRGRLSALALGLGCIVTLGLAPAPRAQQALPGSELTIRWESGTRTATARTSADALADLLQLASRPDAEHLVVQFARRPDAARRAALHAAGLELLDGLGDHAWFARVVPARLDPAVLLAADDLRLAQPVPAEHKFDRLLHERLGRASVAQAVADLPTHAVVRPHATDPELGVYARFHADVDMTRAVELMDAFGAPVISHVEAARALVLHVPFSRLESLAGLDEVQWIELAMPAFVGGNDDAADNSGAADVQAPPPTGYGLDGDDVRVMVYDTGPADANHPDFGGRLSNQDSSFQDPGDHSHATHIAGTIGADGSVSPAPGFAGMAPAVDLDVYGYESPSLPDPTIYGPGNWYVLYQDPGDIQEDYAHAINVRGADVSNASLTSFVSFRAYPYYVDQPFGGDSCAERPICSVLGNYGVTSCLLDSIAIGALGRPFPMVWIVGNDRGWVSEAAIGGPGSHPMCPYAPCTQLGDETSGYGTISPPGSSKNPIIVGSIDGNRSAASFFSSWGPTDDGRIKPDLVALGENITSTLCDTITDPNGTHPCINGNPLTGGYGNIVTSPTDPTATYGEASGTSMAAPVVTGLCALLIDYHREAFGGPDPLNSTLKALLVHNAARPSSMPAGPTYETGWGIAKVDDTIRFMDPSASPPGHFAEAVVRDGEEYRLDVTVMPGDDLKVTLAWDDLPGTPNAFSELVNDLDLSILSPEVDPVEGGRYSYHPWAILSPGTAAVQTNTKDDPFVRIDDDNNVEQVRLLDANVTGAPETWTIVVKGTSVDTPYAYAPAALAEQVFSLCVSFDEADLSVDCDGDGTPDAVQIAASPALDGNGDGVLDACEPDCNSNGVPDADDIAAGFSQDWNGDGIPDECLVPQVHPATPQDHCVDAEPLCPGVHFGANFDADNLPAATNTCTNTFGEESDVWYSYTPATNGTLDLHIDIPDPGVGSPPGISLAIFDTCPTDGQSSPPVSIACASQTSMPLDLLGVPVSVGNTYFVRVSMGFIPFGPPAASEYVLTVSGPPCFVDPDGGGQPCAQDLGFGGPGTGRLSMCGPPLEPGNTNNLWITGGPLNAFGILFGSLAFNPTPFMGGSTLVTIPINIQAALPLNLPGLQPGEGLAFVPVAGFAGLTGPVALFLQYAYQDPSLPFGVGTTNAIKVVFLP